MSLTRPRHIEQVERMHLPDPTPDNRVLTAFEPSKEARNAMLATGMADGMESSFARFDGLALATG